MTLLKPEVKARWVKALRSGRYKQGQGLLETSDGRNCCLGVLCHVMRVKKTRSETDGTCFDGCRIYPPASIHEKIFNSSKRQAQHYYDLQGHFDKLVYMNDHGGYDFHTIANYIEQNF